MLYETVRCLRDEVFVDRRAPGAAHPLDRVQVFDGDGNAAQAASLRHGLCHERLGVRAGPVETERGQGVHRRLDLSDAGLQRVEQIDWADLSRFQQSRDLRSGLRDEGLVGGHGTVLSMKAYGGDCPRPNTMRERADPQ